MIFKLDKYFNTSRMKYIFIDSLMTKDKIIKEVFLKGLGISYNSFRVEKSKEKVSNDTAERLFQYYKIAPVNPKDKAEYEKCLNAVYYAIYFKERDKICDGISFLNSYIEAGNYLKPLFILFRIYGYMNIGSSASTIWQDLKNDLDYIAKIKKDYFIEEFRMIYEAVLYSFKLQSDLTDLRNLAIDYPKLKWIYLSAVGTVYYLKQEDEKALRCYQQLSLEFQHTKNSERQMIVHSNLCFIYNSLQEYAVSLKLAEEVLEYIYSSKDTVWISNMTMHYLFAEFMLSRYEEILVFSTDNLLDKSRLNWVSEIICILAAYLGKRQRLTKELLEGFRENRYFPVLSQYISTGNKEVLSALKQTPYVRQIIAKLK